MKQTKAELQKFNKQISDSLKEVQRSNGRLIVEKKELKVLNEVLDKKLSEAKRPEFIKEELFYAHDGSTTYWIKKYRDSWSNYDFIARFKSEKKRDEMFLKCLEKSIQRKVTIV